jgi:hypothetical protein
MIFYTNKSPVFNNQSQLFLKLQSINYNNDFSQSAIKLLDSTLSIKVELK